METIDYPTRKDLVSALVDFRKRGIHAEVVHNGRTLSFPDGVEDTAEDEQSIPDADSTEHEAPADGVEKTPVEGDTLLGVTTPEEDVPMDRSTFTIEGKCSECEQPAIADAEGGWIHVDAANHGDNEGKFVPNEEASTGDDGSADEKVEDLIGEVPEAPKRKRTRNQASSNE